MWTLGRDPLPLVAQWGLGESCDCREPVFPVCTVMRMIPLAVRRDTVLKSCWSRARLWVDFSLKDGDEYQPVKGNGFRGAMWAANRQVSLGSALFIAESALDSQGEGHRRMVQAEVGSLLPCRESGQAGQGLSVHFG